MTSKAQVGVDTRPSAGHRVERSVALAAVVVVASCSPPSAFPVITGSRGCVIEQLTSEPYGGYHFHGASDDGEWLAYSWTDGEDDDGNPIRGTRRLNLSTGERLPLPDTINNGGAFSSDGSLLVGAYYMDDGRTEILELDLASGDIRVIAPDPGFDFLPSYSPDDRWIVFNSTRTGNPELYLYDRAADSLQRITSYEGYDAHGEFSPDGRKISFHRMNSRRAEGGFDFDLYVYDLASREETRLTSSPYEESYASWAPDSETLVYSSDVDEQPEQHNLYVRHPDGSSTQLTDGDWKDSYAYWSRDGRYIYFNSDRGSVENVYRMRMDGTACVTAD